MRPEDFASWTNAISGAVALLAGFIAGLRRGRRRPK